MRCFRLKIRVPQSESSIRNYDWRGFDRFVLSHYRDANSDREKYLQCPHKLTGYSFDATFPNCFKIPIALIDQRSKREIV